MIHNSSEAEGTSAREMEGMAKLSTVLSTETSRTGSMRTASAIHERTPARAGPSEDPSFEESTDIAMLKILYRPAGLLYRLDGMFRHFL